MDNDSNFSDGHYDTDEGDIEDDSSSDINTNPHSNDVRSSMRCHRQSNIDSPSLFRELEMLKNPKRDAYCQCSKKRQEKELFCDCGEEDQFFEWVWDLESKSKSCELFSNQREVRFHSGFSTGTAAVRSDKPMTDGQYYWEIKMITPVYGTDMMVGIGTERVNPDSALYSFKSFLGLDSESWGLSCYGNIQHDKHLSSHKSAKFSQGSIIGFHLDTWLGNLHLYKNRIHLGVIFRNLRGKNLYAMAASTAARTGMRLIRSVSHPTNLLYLCCNILRKYVPPEYDLLNVLNFPPGLKEFLRNNLTWLISSDKMDSAASIIASSLSAKQSRKRSIDPEDREIMSSKQVKISPQIVENDSSSEENDNVVN